MADNEELDPPPPQDIYNVLAAADLSSCSSSASAKYKRSWLKAKVICSFILSAGNPHACAVDNYPLHQIIEKSSPSWLVTDAIFPKNMPIQLTHMKKIKIKISHATSVINKLK